MWRWIADRDFERLAEWRQARAERAGLKRPPVRVRRPTPAGHAWEAADRAAGRTGRWEWSEDCGCQVSWRPSMLPPGVTRAAAPATAPADPAELERRRAFVASQLKRASAELAPSGAAPQAPAPAPAESATGPPEGLSFE
jgi:hypothetical protein